MCWVCRNNRFSFLLKHSLYMCMPLFKLPSNVRPYEHSKNTFRCDQMSTKPITCQGKLLRIGPSPSQGRVRCRDCGQRDKNLFPLPYRTIFLLYRGPCSIGKICVTRWGQWMGVPSSWMWSGGLNKRWYHQGIMGVPRSYLSRDQCLCGNFVEWCFTKSRLGGNARLLRRPSKGQSFTSLTNRSKVWKTDSVHNDGWHFCFADLSIGLHFRPRMGPPRTGVYQGVSK